MEDVTKAIASQDAKEMVLERVSGKTWLQIYREARARRHPYPLAVVTLAITWHRHAGLTARQLRYITYGSLSLGLYIAVEFMSGMRLALFTLSGALAFLLVALIVKETSETFIFHWWSEVRGNKLDDVPEKWPLPPSPE